MKVILTEKINKLGNIGDTVDVRTGYARNYLLPNGKAMRWSRENVAVFEAKKADLQKKQDAAKKSAEGLMDAVKNAKLHMIRQAGDTGHLYGSVSSRDIARMLSEMVGTTIESAQVMMGSPIKSVGAFDTKIMLHADVIVPVKIYVAQTQDEIDALVAGKVLTFGTKKLEEETPAAEAPAEGDEPTPVAAETDEEPVKKTRGKKKEKTEEAEDETEDVAKDEVAEKSEESAE